MDKIQFISMIEGVEETMPIIPASQQKYDWVQKAAKDFKDNGSLIKNKDVPSHNKNDVQHTSKCPGIIKLKGKGFIVRNHSDIKLTLKDNTYNWNTPTNWTEMSDNLCEDTITHHFQESLHDFMSDWPKDTLETPLKIGLPWMIKIPKGWEVLMVDPFYKDDSRFTVCPGIFQSELGLAVLNVPILWHSKKGEWLIKSGTPIAQLIPGKDYLNPNLKLIIDDMIENEDQLKFIDFLQTWTIKKVKNELSDLIELKNIEESNSNIRALAYQIYENNGVVKKENVNVFTKILKQDERKILRKLGVKFGRYHVFLHKLFKPNAVSLRLLLWKNFHQKHLNLAPPKFGLNFLEDKNKINQNLMLICGFERFENYYVRIDILERLFLKIIDSENDKKNGIKISADMLNLLGCNKENFIKLIQKMGYKTIEINNEVYFKYLSVKKVKKTSIPVRKNQDNPFKILKDIKFK